MRKLQLGTSLEGPSQITPTSPCHGHLLPEEEEEEEEDDLGNGEEESCKSTVNTQSISDVCLSSHTRVMPQCAVKGLVT